MLDDFGYDAAVGYRRGRLGEQLAQAAPEGIDVYLDSVGGDHLQAAITAIRPGGRIALVGAISGYNTTEPARGPDNLFQSAAKEVTLRGMLVSSYFTLFPEWIGQASGRLADGTLRTEETVTEGIEEAPGGLPGHDARHEHRQGTGPPGDRAVMTGACRQAPGGGPGSARGLDEGPSPLVPA
ncbi:zinc-binding dehydrogenase [Streptomyces syringium]|uniref:zinc-binding dehydrogenase n=1 Tax=Streptomyces syringium TaxID=76729 RepID=UPI0034338AE1